MNVEQTIIVKPNDGSWLCIEESNGQRRSCPTKSSAVLMAFTAAQEQQPALVTICDRDGYAGLVFCIE